jgi:hypothetical protein
MIHARYVSWVSAALVPGGGSCQLKNDRPQVSRPQDSNLSADKFESCGRLTVFKVCGASAFLENLDTVLV